MCRKDTNFNQRYIFFFDNAGVHKSQEIIDLLARFNAFALFNCPYSPYMNIIEFAFADIKRALKAQPYENK